MGYLVSPYYNILVPQPIVCSTHSVSMRAVGWCGIGLDPSLKLVDTYMPFVYNILKADLELKSVEISNYVQPSKCV